ncbi:c-type cytochrome [Geothrix alkalitolerans]|uniref:c-type cytochrome n=1 Tax=Geothrix alkalitolerans TaxID=2922724 RepID=UPI001FAF7B45|nr:c-type cytochrome [Geothrix alkalitolerans]
MRVGVMILALLIPIGLAAQAPMKSVDELRAFFAENCVKCHGPDGSAHSAEGKKLGGFDFTDAKMAAKETDADMIKTIRKGIFFGLVMPSFKAKLTEDDAALLVKEVLRKAEKGKAIAPKAGTGR